jgi:hypothetical protein
MFENPWSALFALAADQYSVVARYQARRLGIDDRTFSRRVRAEGWQQPHRGVYVVPGAPWHPRTRMSAALLAAGPHAAASGLTALHLHGVADAQPPRLALVVPHERRARPLHGAKVVRSRTLRHGDVTEVGGLRCVRPPRAFLEASPEVDDGRLRTLLIDGRQRLVVMPEEVIERAAKSPLRLPGRHRLIAVASDIAGIGADSVLTDLVHRRLVADGFHPDPTPVSITINGRTLHPDITFAGARLSIECDSLAHHGDQRSLDMDHRKDQAYAAAWWRCLRIGWYRYDNDWSGFLTALRHALDEWPRVLAALGG